jgi:hypothetical protein
MKVWITKYALSEGIKEAESKSIESDYGYLSVEGYWSSFSRKEYATTKEDAIKQANDKRIKKIASLKKQISNLENLKF